jgi:hypothetical protein
MVFITRMDSCCQLPGVINTKVARELEQKSPDKVKITWDKRPGAKTFNGVTVTVQGDMVAQVVFTDSVDVTKQVEMRIRFKIIDDVSVHPLIGWPVIYKHVDRNKRDDTMTICDRVVVNMVRRGASYLKEREIREVLALSGQAGREEVAAISGVMGDLVDKEAIFVSSPTTRRNK